MARPDLNAILAMLDEENIAKAVTIPHAIAREQYKLQKITVQSFEEFRNEIGRYYSYQIGATVPGGKVFMSEWLAKGYAEKIVDSAFSKIGGLEGAYKMAEKGINGGLKPIIDSIYMAIVREQEENYIEDILTRCINPMSWNDKVTFMEQFLIKFGGPLSSGKPIKNAMEVAPHYKDFIKFLMEKVHTIRYKLGR